MVQPEQPRQLDAVVEPDGTVYTKFDLEQRPVAGTLPGQDGAPAQQFTVAYDPSGADTWMLSDQTMLRHDPQGNLVEERLPDGTDFTAFDTQGRPTAGVVAGVGGTPSRGVAISYQPDGSAVWRYADQSTSVVNQDHAVVERTTPDGWRYTGFNQDGQPTVADKGDQHVTIAYAPDGSSTWTYADQTVVDRNPQGDVTSMSTPQGWTFSSFDPSGRPTKGIDGDRSVSIAYQANGDSVWSFGDGTVETRSANGDQPIEIVTPEGWTFTAFDGSGRPTAGHNGDQAVAISYAAPGDNSPSVWTFANGTVVRRDSSGATVSMTTPDGWTFTSFDSSGRPLTGTNGNQAVAITYAANGNSVWNLGPGQPVTTYDAHGNLVSVLTPEGWLFDQFAGNRPTHGYNQNLNLYATITYNPDGTEKWGFSDGSALVTDANGKPIEEIVPDGKGGFVDIVFAVELPLMRDTVYRTRNNQLLIYAAMTMLKSQMQDITQNWTGPAATDYAARVDGISKVIDDFSKVFNDAVERMRTAYNNYVDTETTNSNTFQSGGSRLAGGRR